MKILKKRLWNTIGVLALGMSLSQAKSWAEPSQASEQQLGSQGSENDSPDGLALDRGVSPALLPNTSQASFNREAESGGAAPAPSQSNGGSSFSVPSDGVQTTNFHVYSTD